MTSKNNFFVLSLILFVILIWAGNFISIRYIIEEIDVFTALTLRLAFVSLFLAAFLRPFPSKKDFYFIFLASLAIVPGHFGLLFFSIANTSSVGGVSVLIQLSIPFSIIIAWIIFKDKPSTLRIIGLVISFLGIVILLYDPSLLENRYAFIIAIGSALCLGIYVNIIKKIRKVKSISIIAWLSLFGTPMMYMIMLLNDNTFTSLLDIEQSTTIWAFFYTVIGSSIIGHGIWAYLVKTQDISFISPFLLLVPIVTVILSAFILDEIITLNFVIVSSIIIFGIFLVFISKNSQNNNKD